MQRAAVILAAILAGCGGDVGGAYAVMPPGNLQPSSQLPGDPIKHIVVIIQENRSVDDLLQFVPALDTASSGPSVAGKMIRLVPRPLTAPFDIRHEHADFESAYRAGAMNGWDDEKCEGACPNNPAYAYVPQSEVQPYYDLCEQYVCADRMFQTNQGPSFPAHEYLLSATSSIADGSPFRASENPSGDNGIFVRGGCDSPADTLTETIDPKGVEGSPVFPCFNRRSIVQELTESGVSWKYYQAVDGAGYWNGVDALKPVWQKPDYRKNVVSPSTRVLNDISQGLLPSVSFVTPSAACSDHATITSGCGPSWVASVVNAIGQSPYWGSTAILITWDDWGGWYDHVKPTIYDSYTDGFRVPFIVVSPYGLARHIDHKQHEFGSILKFIEHTFKVPSLGETDARCDDLSADFKYTQTPLKFHRILARYGKEWFVKRRVDDRIPDDD